MRKALVSLLFVLLAGGLCRAGTTGKLARFRQVESRYYTFDSQAFKSASCRIESPLLDRELDALNRSLAGMVEFDAPLKRYRLVYRTPRDISIVDPELSIRVVSTRIADPSRLKLGEAQIKRGFEGQITGIDTQIRSILEGFEPRDPQKLHVESVTPTGAGYKLHYRYDGSDVTEEISGTTRISFQNQAGSAVTAVERYKPAASGKLLLQHATVRMQSAANRLKFDVGMTYQTLKSVIFPETIGIDGLITRPASRQRTRLHYAIRLADCKLL